MSVFSCRSGQSFSTTDAGQLPARDALQTAERAAEEAVRHALRALIHHRPARSEHKITLYTNQSLKQLLTFYASVIDCSTGWANHPCPSLKFGFFKRPCVRPVPQPWHKSAQSFRQTQKCKWAIMCNATPVRTRVHLSWTAFWRSVSARVPGRTHRISDDGDRRST